MKMNWHAGDSVSGNAVRMGGWAGRMIVTVATLTILILAFAGATATALVLQAPSQRGNARLKDAQTQPAQTQPAPSQTWTTYGDGNARDGNNSAPSSLTVSSASSLKPIWTLQYGPVSAQPIVANGRVYWGDWNGYEHAATLNGTPEWATPLGTTDDPGCNPPKAGVASTGTVATVNGRSLLFVGGGNATFYALDAATGNVVWSTPLGASPATFIWASPAFYNGSIYIPISSFGDCPLVQGKLFKLDAATGAIQDTFDAAPNGCVGVGIWGSPAIDEATGTVYVATGNAGPCNSREIYAEAVVALRASNLSVISSWQVPAREAIGDSDFGATPTLFTSGGRQLVGAGNKNGIFYALDRHHLSTGPIWRARLATPYLCPNTCTGLIGIAAFTGSQLFVGGGQTHIGSQSCDGTLRALNPTNGHLQWSDCLHGGVVVGPVTAASGIVTASAGEHVFVVSASSGQILYSYDGGAHDLFYAGPSIVDGRIYIGDMEGTLYTFDNIG